MSTTGESSKETSTNQPTVDVPRSPVPNETAFNPPRLFPVAEGHPSPHRRGQGIPPISPRTSKELHPHLRHMGSQSPPRIGRDRSKSVGHHPSPYPFSLSGGGGGNVFYPPSPFGPSPSASPIMTRTGALELSSGMPYMPNLQPGGQTRTAMEHAVQCERDRAKEMEKEEEHMTADELRMVLKKERNRMARYAADLAALKSAAVQSQAEAEVFEEGRINSLMRRVESLQQEKGRIILELEREEEMLTNNLQKKLDEVRREKALLEKQIEKEQSHHSDLKTKLTDMVEAKERPLDES